MRSLFIASAGALGHAFDSGFASPLYRSTQMQKYLCIRDVSSPNTAACLFSSP